MTNSYAKYPRQKVGVRVSKAIQEERRRVEQARHKAIITHHVKLEKELLAKAMEDKAAFGNCYPSDMIEWFLSTLYELHYVVRPMNRRERYMITGELDK